MASRVAKSPVKIPTGVDVKIEGQQVTVKGKHGVLTQRLSAAVQLVQENGELRVKAISDSRESNKQAGTERALLNNLVRGVEKGFERKLLLHGVGYRAKVEAKKLVLIVGYSNPVEVRMPEGVSVETPAATEILVKGANKALVNQIAANIRAIRPVERYKGKGIRYSDERIVLKETKKK